MLISEIKTLYVYFTHCVEITRVFMRTDIPLR